MSIIILRFVEKFIGIFQRSLTEFWGKKRIGEPWKQHKKLCKTTGIFLNFSETFRKVIDVSNIFRLSKYSCSRYPQANFWWSSWFEREFFHFPEQIYSARNMYSDKNRFEHKNWGPISKMSTGQDKNCTFACGPGKDRSFARHTSSFFEVKKLLNFPFPSFTFYLYPKFHINFFNMID